jgi:sugar lactone lactonase YvrE
MENLFCARPTRIFNPRSALISCLIIGLGLVAAVTKSRGAPGDLYETNYDAHTIQRLAPNGQAAVYSTDFAASGIAFDANKNLFVTDYDDGLIYKFTPAGTRTVFANGLHNPYALAFDSAGNLFVTDYGTGSVYKFTPDGAKSIFATGIFLAGGLAFGPNGVLYVGGYGHMSNGTSNIYKLDSNGIKTVFTNRVTSTGGLAFDSAGNLFVGDFGANKIVKIDRAGQATVFATSVRQPAGVIFDPAGNLLVADYGTSRILKFTPDGTMSVFATGLNGVTLFAYEPADTTPSPPQLLNISTRMRVLTGDKVLIGGFILTGSGPRKVIIRGIGPSLTSAGIEGVLPDPALELHHGDTIVATNDNWKEHQAEVEQTTLQPKSDLESAIVATLDPGAYSVILADRNGAEGVGLVEVYNLDANPGSQLANISTRGFVDIDNNVMVGGFIAGGSSSDSLRVVIRALGPSLADFGLSSLLANPTLELHDAQGATVATNDDWKSDQQAEIEATNLAPTKDLESAIVTTVTPGNHTAVVRGIDGSTGTGLVEIYHLH